MSKLWFCFGRRMGDVDIAPVTFLTTLWATSKEDALEKIKFHYESVVDDYQWFVMPLEEL